MSFFKWFITLTGPVMLVFSACSTQAGSGEMPKTAALVSEVPATELDVAGDIPAIDFAVDEEESLHVVWRAVFSNNDRPSLNSDKILYARGDRGGASWSQPIQVGENRLADDHLRILIGAGGLHIIFGRNLRHLSSGDGGKTWRESAPLIPNQESRADVFDAVVVGDSLVVAYLFHPRPAYEIDKRTPKDDQKLYVVRWSPEELSAPMLIASLPGSLNGPPSPRILAEGTRLHLMCGINADRRDGAGVGVAGRLFYLRSDDRGTSWSSPVEASVGAAKGATSSGNSGIQTLGTIELLPTPERLYAFYHDSGLFMTRTKDGSDWSPAVELGGQGRTESSANFHSDSVSVAAIGGAGRLAWIDTRFRKSDRHWWSPLGGVPWSDETDWKNNDVFTVTVSDVVGLSAVSVPAKSPSAPARLTEQLSYANSVRVRASKTRIFVLWSGRSKVGKRLDTFGQKPRLFYGTVPL
jgi:hypothetical protein